MFFALIGEVAFLFILFLLGAVWFKKKSQSTLSIWVELKNDVMAAISWVKNQFTKTGLNKPM